MWQTAVRPDLLLRNNAGDEVTEEEWNVEYKESDAGLWTKKISDWASGRFPDYRLGERTRIEGLSRERSSTVANAERLLREAVPSEEFVRQMCHDARELVIGCAIGTDVRPNVRKNERADGRSYQSSLRQTGCRRVGKKTTRQVGQSHGQTNVRENRTPPNSRTGDPLVVLYTSAVHPASSITRKESCTSADTIFTTSLVSRRRIP